MPDNDREIFVDQKYPIPAFVDGINRIPPNLDPETVEWDDTDIPFDGSLQLDESGGTEAGVGVPTPLEVIEQKAVATPGGQVQVSAILVIEEVAGVSDYEIRVVTR